MASSLSCCYRVVASHPPAGTVAGAAPPPETSGTGVSTSGFTRGISPLLSGVSALLLLVVACAFGNALAAGIGRTGVGSGVAALGALEAPAGVAGTGVGSRAAALGALGALLVLQAQVLDFTSSLFPPFLRL